MKTPVTFTNLDKIYWPEDGYTKRDLITYYVEVAPFILPYLKDRPLSLNRHPDGIHGKSFFQKDTAHLKPPAWVQRAPIMSESKGREKLYLLCQDAPTLTYVANLGYRKLPKTTSIARLPSQRQGLVYLDYLQNGKSQTMAVPYSARPVPGATVSAPLAWREVTNKLDPTRFTIKTMPKRAQRVGDLWTPLLRRGVDLGKCLERLVAAEKNKRSKQK